jgi:uncharacterized protein with GYD domain
VRPELQQICLFGAQWAHLLTKIGLIAFKLNVGMDHIMTGTWTDRGIRGVKDAPKRAQAARDLAKKLGVEIKQVFLTSGESDLLLILETSNADNIPKFALAIGSLGNLRTRTGWPYVPRTASFNPPTAFFGLAFSSQLLVAEDLPCGFFHRSFGLLCPLIQSLSIADILVIYLLGVLR